MHSNNFFFCTAPQGDKMIDEDVGKKVVVVISENRGKTDTVKGTIVQVIDEELFEIEDQWGNRSRWNERQIKGIKFLGDNSG